VESDIDTRLIELRIGSHRIAVHGGFHDRAKEVLEKMTHLLSGLYAKTLKERGGPKFKIVR
jgi:hypothetical protein